MRHQPSCQDMMLVVTFVQTAVTSKLVCVTYRNEIRTERARRPPQREVEGMVLELQVAKQVTAVPVWVSTFVNVTPQDIFLVRRARDDLSVGRILELLSLEVRTSAVVFVVTHLDFFLWGFWTFPAVLAVTKNRYFKLKHDIFQTLTQLVF